MSRFHVFCALLCYLYSMAMTHIFLCASCTTLILAFRGNGEIVTVLRAHLLLLFCHISVVLIHNENYFQHFSYNLVLDPLFYIGTTPLWFVNLLSWLFLQLSVTSLVICISVWLYVTTSYLYGCAITSLWYLQSWDFLFPCIS